MAVAGADGEKLGQSRRGAATEGGVEFGDLRRVGGGDGGSLSRCGLVCLGVSYYAGAFIDACEVVSRQYLDIIAPHPNDWNRCEEAGSSGADRTGRGETQQMVGAPLQPAAAITSLC